MPPRAASLPVVTAALLALSASTAASSPAGRIGARSITTVAARPVESTITPAQARILESRLSRLPATTVIETTTANPAGTVAQPEPALPDSPTLPALGPRLEYVPVDRSFEQQVASVLASQTAIRRAIGSQGRILPFPGILRQVEQSGEVYQLKAFGLSGRRLAYDPANKMFVGTIWLGVNEIVPGRPSRPLATPVEFEVLDADSAEPSQVQVTRTGSPYAQVRLRLAAAVDGGTVSVASNLMQEPIRLTLPVSPALIIEAGHSVIEGLGLGTSDINVSVLGLPNPRGRVVTLRTNSGYLRDTRLRLDENGVATTAIRSDAIGTARISASSPGLAATRTEVHYRFPHITLLASIAGGLAGGLIRVGTRPPRRRASQARLLAVAMLFGLLVFALYAVGVNVLPVSPTVTIGAALVFALSGLGAFLGPGLLRRA